MIDGVPFLLAGGDPSWTHREDAPAPPPSPVGAIVLYPRTCTFCGNPWKSRVDTARFCSKSCERRYVWRERKMTPSEAGRLGGIAAADARDRARRCP